MNLSESMRHFADMITEQQSVESYITYGINTWNKNAGGEDVPPINKDGTKPLIYRDQPPQPDWSAGHLERWLLAFGDTKLGNKRSRHKPYPGSSLPKLSVMLREPDWHDFVRYFKIVQAATSKANQQVAYGKDDETAYNTLRPMWRALGKEHKRRALEIQAREYEQYDMEGRIRRERGEDPNQPSDDGGFDWD